MGRGSGAKRLGAGGSSGKISGGIAGQDLAKELNLNGGSSAIDYARAATILDKSLNLGDSITISDNDPDYPSFKAYIKDSNNRYRYVGSGQSQVLDGNAMARMINYYGQNGQKSKIEKYDDVVFTNHAGNRSHAIILSKKPSAVDDNKWIGNYSKNGKTYEVYAPQAISTTFGYIAVKKP